MTVEMVAAIANLLWPICVLIFFLICAVYYTVKHRAFTLPQYRIRAENIRLHGWPPAGMDADGDWHPTTAANDSAEDEEE